MTANSALASVGIELFYSSESLYSQLGSDGVCALSFLSLMGGRMKYQGSCHCGNIKFEVEGDINEALSCNCSICQRKGSLLSFFPADQFTLLSTGENIGSYTFNKHVIHHKFCQVCGISPYAEGADPKGNRFAAVNIRCIEDIDLGKIPMTHFNGKDR